MILTQFKTLFTEQLSSIYPKTEIDSFFFLLIEEKLDLQRVDSILQPDFLIPSEDLRFLKNALKKLQKEEPIQYILGKTEFYGLQFFVNKNTLIPRPETEELIHWILKSVSTKRESELSILDIGTGTGCISIPLKKRLKNATVFAIDISKKALEIAKKNAILNKTNIHFFQTDILQINSLNFVQKNLHFKNNIFDIIVSNPPYIRDLEKKEMKNNVLQNEPHLALFVKNDAPLIFYEKIADLAKKHLAKNGLLFFEINQYLTKETVKMLSLKGFKNIELQKDLFGNYRMIKSKLKIA